jgi:P4 family phage/plasmid primase-like protien
MPTLRDYLKMNVAGKGEGITHTRIADKELKIYGGIYNISDDKFYDIYYNQVFNLELDEYLTEKQSFDNSPLVLDLDFRYDTSITERQHSKDHILDIIMESYEYLKEYYDLNDIPIEVFVMEKPQPNCLADKTKDGVHILFNFATDRGLSVLIRNALINKIKKEKWFDDLPLTNTVEDVIDEGVIKGQCNWLMYGSKKPTDKHPYKVVNKYSIINDKINNLDFNLENDFKTLCIRSGVHLKLKFKEDLSREQIATWELTCMSLSNRKKEKSNETLTNEIIENANPIDFTNKKEIEILLECCKGRFETGKHKEWIDIAQVLKNEYSKDDAMNIFVEATKKYGSDNKKTEAKETINRIKHTPKSASNRLTIKSLHYWASQDNNTLYREYKQSLNTKPNIDILIDSIKQDEDVERFIKTLKKYNIIDAFTENDAGNCFLETMKLKDDIVCYDLTPNKYKIFKYSNEKCLWEFRTDRAFIKNALSTDFVNIIKKYSNSLQFQFKSLQDKGIDKSGVNDKLMDDLIKKISRTNDAITNLKKTQWKNNITSEIFEICYNPNTDLINQYNTEKYIVPFKNNKVIDLRDNKVYNRTREHNFSFECNFNFIEKYDENNKGFVFADKYFKDLFCNNQETILAVLNILKTMIIGIPMRYVFFMTGEGRNGKSILLKILRNAFGNFVDTISKLVIIKQKGNFTSTLNTEVEKLTNCRIGFVSELSDEDECNIERIKEITGGDPINFRGMRQTDITIIPTCSLLNVTNELPKIKAQQAIIDRTVLIPFNARFNVDTTFEKKVMDNIDYIISYIFHNGKVIDGDLVVSEEMKASMESYVADNQDKLKEFMTETYSIDETNGESISISDIRVEYINWARLNHYKIDNITPTKTTKLLKSWNYEIYRKATGTSIRHLKRIEKEKNCIIDV